MKHCWTRLIVFVSAMFSFAFAETLILDHTAYFRVYYRFQPDMIDAAILREQGADLLGSTPFRRMASTVRQRFEEQGLDAEGVDWMEHVQARFSTGVLGSYPHAPEGWEQIDFDDSEWVRRRTPMQTGHIRLGLSHTTIRDAYHHVRTSHFRTNFYVEDIRRDAPLTLSMQFRGGVRVFVNGREIVRSHLPEGELTPDSTAHTYPIEAYIVLPDELSEEARAALPGRADEPRDHFRALFESRDLPLSYDEASAGDNEPYLTPEVWERIYNARERRIENITIPASVLRRGRNVLAIELRASSVHPVVIHDEGHGPQRGQANDYDWFAHSRIKWLRLSSRSEQAVSSLERPAGMQVWVADPHDRTYEPDFLEPGAPAGEIRLTAVRNGTFGAQLVIGSDKELSGFKVDLTNLTRPDGPAEIAASSFKIKGSNPRPANSVTGLGGPRGATNRRDMDIPLLQRRYGRQPNHLDELTDELFDTVPADHAMVVWLSLRVPDDARPGTYQGTVTVSAESTEPVEVPLHVEVIDWLLPDPSRFSTFSGVTTYSQSLRNHYDRRRSSRGGVGMYSDEHLELLRRTYQLLSRIGGGDWLDVPVLDSTHEIVWIRQPDDSLTFDFTNLEKLLDVVLDTFGKPRVVNFNIMYPFGNNYTARVPVRNHDSDEIEWVELGPRADAELRESYWRQFAYAVYGFMRTKGLEDRMFWGTPWDREGDPELVYMLASYLPQVHWGRKSHYFLPNEYYRATSTIYAENFLFGSGFHLPHGHQAASTPIDGLRSMMGWNHKGNYRLNNSRWHSSVHYLEGFFPSYGYRLKAERCLIAGYNGYGVYAADSWGQHQGVPFGVQRGGIGTGIVRLFWPGEKGMNTAGRVEMLLEGLQEAEARVFVERALLNGLLPDDLAERAITLLNNRIMLTRHIARSPHSRFGQVFCIHQGWRALNTALFNLAAEVAAITGLELDRTEIQLELLAGSSREISILITNPALAPRAWQASSDSGNVRLSANAGRTTTTDTLTLTVDARQAEPGQHINAVVTVSDSSNGRTHEVQLRANVVPALELRRETHLLFARRGQQRTVESMLVNHTQDEIRWTARPGMQRLTLHPGSGVLPAMASVAVRLVADVRDGIDPSRIETSIRFMDAAGRLISAAPVVVFVEPQQPVIPDGATSTLLVNLDDRIAYHYTLANRRHGMPGRPAREGHNMEAVPFNPHNQGPGDTDEIIYDISGSGFDLFATAIRYRPRREDLTGRGRFQVITDGQIRFDSGWILPGEEDIPVIVPNLREAKRITLLFTRENALANDHGTASWVRPRFYSAEDGD